MFTSQNQQPRNNNSGSSLDLQYEICSQFMKQASEQLLQKELDLMQKTSKFIEKITDNLTAKDISSTQESFTLDTLLEEEDVFSQPSRSRLLLRKSQSSLALRRSESGISEAMGEVRRKCSERTASLLSGMVNQAKRGKQKIGGYDRLEKELKRVQNKFSIKEEELLITRKKLKDLEENYKTAVDEIGTLKLKLKEAKGQYQLGLLKGSSLSECSSRGELSTVSSSPQQQKMKKFLEQKQLYIARKEKDLKALQNQIECSFETPFEEGCEKCCTLMRRIKESLMKYRKFLQQQSLLAESLYQNYKKSFA